MKTSPDGAHEAAARLAEMIRRRAIPSDVKAADEVKRLQDRPDRTSGSSRRPRTFAAVAAEIYAEASVPTVIRGKTSVEEMSMADDPKAIEVPGSWIGTEELPVHFANAFVGTVGPNAVFVNVGSVVPPMFMGDTEEEREAQAVALTYIPIKPIARFALTPEGLDELITALEGTRTNYQNLRKAIEDQEGS